MNDELNLIPSKDAPPGFPFLENHVRARLGLPKDEIRELRGQLLQEDTDWILKKKRIWLSQRAVDALLNAKGIPPKKTALKAPAPNAEAGEPLKAKPTKKTAPPEPVELQAIRATKNKHILLACGLKDNPRCPKKPLRIRVKSTEHFRPGLKFQAQLVDGYEDLYDLVGPYPRKMAFTPMAQA